MWPDVNSVNQLPNRLPIVITVKMSYLPYSTVQVLHMEESKKYWLLYISHE